jgi:hypothetical protein
MQNTILTKRLKDERVVEKWSTLIEGAAGKGDMLYKFIAEKLDSLHVPNITVARQLIKPERGGIEKEKREFLVVENTKIINYDIYISARDYGSQLSVSWYMVLEKDTLTRSMKQRPIYTLIRAPFVLLGNILAIASRHSEGVASATGGNTEVSGFGGGFNLFDQEEIGAYTATVHGAMKDGVEEIMEGLNLDFAKIDTKTRGFLNIS